MLKILHGSYNANKEPLFLRGTNTFCLYGACEGSSSVHLVLSWLRHIKSWERHINSWERDFMSWPRDRFVEVTTSLCCGQEMLF